MIEGNKVYNGLYRILLALRDGCPFPLPHFPSGEAL